MKRSTVLKIVMKSSLEAMEKPTASHEAVSRWSRAEGVLKKDLDLNCQRVEDKVSLQVWVHLILEHSKWVLQSTFVVSFLFTIAPVWGRKQLERSVRCWQNLTPFTRIEMEELKFQSVLSAMVGTAPPCVHLPSSSLHLYHGLADLGSA